MRQISILAAAIILAACSGDDGGGGGDAGNGSDATVDPATAHELGTCDRASYDPVVTLPNGAQCERACESLTAHPGPSCTINCAMATACPTTQDYGGLDGCCVYDSSVAQMKFCECE